VWRAAVEKIFNSHLTTLQLRTLSSHSRAPAGPSAPLTLLLELSSQQSYTVADLFSKFPGTQQIAVMYNARGGDLSGIGHVVSIWRQPGVSDRYQYYDPRDNVSAPFAADEVLSDPAGSFRTAVLAVGVTRTLFALSLPSAFIDRGSIRERFDSALASAFARLPFHLLTGDPQTQAARDMLGI